MSDTPDTPETDANALVYSCGHVTCADFARKLERERDMFREDHYSSINLIQRIREAAGDPMGKLMQDELVEHIRNLRKKVNEQTAERRA